MTETEMIVVGRLILFSMLNSPAIYFLYSFLKGCNTMTETEARAFKEMILCL